MKLKTCLSDLSFTAKPAGAQIAQISETIAAQSCSIAFNDFVAAVSSGQSFTLATGFEGNKRSKRTAQSLQVFAADIDDGNLSYEDLKKLADEFSLPASVIYESFSSTLQARKWRVLFFSKDPVTDPAIALHILRTIKEHFNSDQAIVDLSRLLFGTSGSSKVRFSKEVYFDAFKIRAPRSPSKPVEYLALPTTKTKLSKLQVKNVYKILSKLRAKESRYSRVYNATISLANMKILTREQILATILVELNKIPDFANYDKNPQDIIEKTLNWIAKNND
jgi:hypothetical protein